jgi:CelD/BcsL family acetyltransferase involved in cellulose biosynthesis
VSADPLRLERVADLEDVRPEWNRLAELTGHPFATWEWVTAWWRWFGAGRELYTYVCRAEDGRVVAIVPMYVATVRPLRIARFIGYGDLSSPLCAPEDRPAVAAALSRMAGWRRGACRIIVAEKLPGGLGWSEMIDGTLISHHADPILRLNGIGWDDFLAGRSRNFRSNIGRKERRLQRDYDVVYRRSDDHERLDADLDTLFRLHATRWGDETTGVFEGDRALMHRELAHAALDAGYLNLWVMELDGIPVAAYLGWRFAGSEWFLQSGRDPDYLKQEVGKALLTNVIREACNDGVDAFRFLAGDETYKFRWTDEDVPAESMLVAPGALGRVAALAIGHVQSLPAPLRARVMKLTG